MRSALSIARRSSSDVAHGDSMRAAVCLFVFLSVCLFFTPHSAWFSYRFNVWYCNYSRVVWQGGPSADNATSLVTARARRARAKSSYGNQY